MTAIRRGFGITGTVAHDVIAQVAAAAEAAGYTSFWINDIPGGDGPSALAAAASSTSTITLVSGVLGLSRRSAEDIVLALRSNDLPLERFWLGIGTGGGPGGPGRVRAALPALRAHLGPDVPIFVAATGPRIRTLAAREADGVLLNWPVPTSAQEARTFITDTAHAAGRSAPRVAAYLRCALSPQADAAADHEADAHAGSGMYADILARHGSSPRASILRGPDRASLQAQLTAFDGILDEPVVRAITVDEDAAQILELLHTCAPSAAAPTA